MITKKTYVKTPKISPSDFCIIESSSLKEEEVMVGIHVVVQGILGIMKFSSSKAKMQ